MAGELRTESFGQARALTVVDRFGIWLSARQILRYVSTFRDKRLGDFGCGYHASFARTVLDQARHAVLADVRLAPDLKAHPKVTALEGPLPDSLAALPDGSLDIALCVSMLEHLWDDAGMLRALWRVLAPGGVCLLNVPSWRGKWFLELSAFRFGFSPPEEMDDHKRYYDVKDLWPELVRAGFKPRNIRCFPHKFGLNTFAVCVRS